MNHLNKILYRRSIFAPVSVCSLWFTSSHSFVTVCWAVDLLCLNHTLTNGLCFTLEWHQIPTEYIISLECVLSWTWIIILHSSACFICRTCSLTHLHHTLSSMSVSRSLMDVWSKDSQGCKMLFSWLRSYGFVPVPQSVQTWVHVVRLSYSD